VQFVRNGRILDVASGTGNLAIAIKRRFPVVQIVALDCDAIMLSRAAYKATRRRMDIRFVQAYAQNLPYADACFGRVVPVCFSTTIWTGTASSRRRTKCTGC